VLYFIKTEFQLLVITFAALRPILTPPLLLVLFLLFILALLALFLLLLLSRLLRLLVFLLLLFVVVVVAVIVRGVLPAVALPLLLRGAGRRTIVAWGVFLRGLYWFNLCCLAVLFVPRLRGLILVLYHA